MYCPFCNADETKVVDSRLVTGGRQIRRRRECVICAKRFTTYESPELIMPAVIKRDGTREPFREESLRLGLQKALEKRPVSVDVVEESIDRIKQRLHSGADREVESSSLGQYVMEELREIDEVAYVRFASVYRRFQDIKDFNTEIHRLKSKESEPTS